MGAIRASRPAEDAPALTAVVEGEIDGLAREEFVPGRVPLPVAAHLPMPAGEGNGCGVGQVNSLIERVARASVLDVEKLVGELQGLRDFLGSEAERVQREIAGYAHLSDAATKSTKIIADSMSQWKGAIDGEHSERF